ncbi:hypothetical protein WAI453_013058 [Rhynchosporium graminicola]
MKYFHAIILLLLGFSSAKALVPRKTASCRDTCGERFSQKTTHPEKSMLVSDCEKYLASTVTGTAVTVTTTTPLAIFANQTLSESTKLTITSTQSTTHTGGPTHAPIPDYMKGVCQVPLVKMQHDLYTSICKCAGATVTQTTVPASTVTVAVHNPTQVSTFKIRVVFENSTFLYLSVGAYNVAGGEYVAKVSPEYANVSSAARYGPADFTLSNGTLLYKPLKLMEYERVLPSLADGTPQMVWFVSQREDRKDHSRPFEITHRNENNKMVHPLVPVEGGAGVDYTEFFICESCGNQLYISTAAWKDGYMRRVATDKYDRYDWVELQAEPDLIQH